MKRMNSIKLLSLLALLTVSGFTPIESGAQTVQVVHDDQKEKQWRSMEVGPWNFAPKWYYYLFHKNYSGAEEHWRWHGFESGWEIDFKESRSDVKTINPSRILSEETQRAKLKKVETERAKVEELYKEDLAKQADRMIDLSYSTYKDHFNHMQDLILDGLTYCIQKSKGEMQCQVNEIVRQNEIICANIEYIHKTGIGYELENSKRQRAYEEARTEMKKIVQRTAKLAAMAMAIY